MKALPLLKRGSFLTLMLSVIVSWPQISFSQKADTPEKQKIDSLYDEAWSYSRTQPEKGLDILEEVKALHAKQDTAYRLGVLYYYYGVFHKNLNQFNESEAAFDQYIDFQNKRNDTLRMAIAIMGKANLYSDAGQFANSTEAAAESMKYFEAVGDTHGIIRASSKIGYMLTEVDRFQEALEYHRRSNALAKAMGHRQEEAISYTNMGLTHEKQIQLDSAYYYYSLALELGEILEEDYDKIINRYNMATILKKLDRLDEAEYFVISCMALADSINIPSLRVASRQLYAEMLLRHGKFEKAIPLLDSLANSLDHDLGLRDKMELYELRAEAYQQKGDFKMAFENFTTFKQLNDSLLGKESRDRLNELEVKYESERQKQQIAFLDLENKTSQTLIAQKDRTILIGGIGLALVTLFSIGLYILIRKYLRQQKALSKALADKDLLLREIHHRVKNNLQIVSSLLSLQGRSIDDEMALKAINAGKSRVRSMALIHQSLYQRENLTGVNVQEYMRKLCNELFHTYDIDEDKVNLDLQIEALELDVDTLVPLGLIVNELITNALKYAFPGGKTGTLTVKLRQSDQILLLEVIDNGVGYDEADVRENSFGRKLISSLIKQLEGVLHTESTNGTRVQLEIHKFQSMKG